MGTASIVLLILGILVLIEGIFLILFPKDIKSITKALLKNVKNIRKIGIIEIIVAVILLLISVSLRSS
ncbi:MAG: DUF2065 family protein [Candidatus Nanoarchaeia archaeon]